MLGTLPVKKYFSTGDSHYVTPKVAAEWNYNLFYPAYATFSGSGTDLSSGVGSWSPASSVASGLGKTSGTNCIQFYSSSQQQSTSVSVTVPSGQNTYKIIFYAKVKESGNINYPAPSVQLTSLAYLDSHRSSSSSKSIDTTQWTKFETYISSRPVDTSYSSFTWTLDFTAEDSTSPYYILVDKISIYQTTDFDYQYGELWPTSSPFTFFRPGESYVPSGNALTPLPANFRKITTQINSPITWSTQMPCSPVLYNPQMLMLQASNPLYKNGLLSDYTKYKYFVSDKTTKQIGAVYEQQLYTNKIVLKFNVAYGKPTIKLNLYGTGYSSGDIIIASSSISDAGVIILYKQTDGSWTTSPWTSPPSFNLNGDIKFEGTSVNGATNINKIIVSQTGFTLNSNYSSKSSVAREDMARMHVIEVSPRLELDLTYFTMNVNTDIELDNKQSPLPISAISSNSASIQLSNVPLAVSNEVLSLFSNNSNSSPLKGLFKKNVKFYVNYVIRDTVPNETSAQNKTIPGGVFYAEEWQGQDIERTNVTLFDVSKQLQLRSPSDYVAEYENVFKVITNILDFAGFTDYDYDSLKKVTLEVTTDANGKVSKNPHPVIAQYFYADGQQQKVFDVLREIFEVYQIGAYVDMYGVLQFLNLHTILSNKTPNLVLHDSKTPITITDPDTNQPISIVSNIVQDTYTETVKAKIGQATIKYRIPQISKTIDPDTTSFLTTGTIDKSDALWVLDKDSMTTFNYLDKSISTTSQNYFQLNKNDLIKTFNSYDINHDGYAIIENEIVSFSDKEYSFDITPGDSVPVTYAYSGNYKSIVSNANDLQRAISEFSAKSGYGGKVKYTPTGKIMNVQRGLFNTPVRTHMIINNVSDLLTKMSVQSGSNTPSVYLNQILMPATTDQRIHVLKPISESNGSSINYNTFSVKMGIGPNSDNQFIDGVGGGMILGMSSTPIYVEIRQDMSNPKKHKGKSIPTYRLYVYQGVESNSLFGTDTPYYEISKTLLNDAISYPDGSPFEEFGKVVNLKFVKTSSSSFEIYLNKNRLATSKANNLSINLTGDFGIFAHSTKAANGSISNGSVAFTELYATQTPLSISNVYYHYEMPSFANSIVGNHKIFEISYMMQTRPQVVGIQHYDVQYSLAPSINAYPFKVAYRWWYFTDPVNNRVSLSNVDVREDALNYSMVYNSGFRGRVVIVNSSPGAVWIKKSPDTVNPLDVVFSINSNNVIVLSEEQSITKIFDQSNISDSIEIKSSWVQSKKAALGILDTVFKAIDGFSRDTMISVYGNPLFEIGDVVNIQYNLKNIGINDDVNNPNRYFVQGIKQTFSQGLQTVLILNQIA